MKAMLKISSNLSGEKNEYENCNRYKCADLWCVFGGFPRKILSAVVGQKITACATAEIINEYEYIVQEMIDRKQGHIDRAILTPLINVCSLSHQ